MPDVQAVIQAVDQASETILNVSHEIWSYAELSLKEFRSAALYVKLLQEKGFEVETGLAGIGTAFSGSFTVGNGGPVIGILGEFDALSGLSQKAASAVREEVVKNGPGHGCGHNMLGAASFGAALALKQIMEEKGIPGTVIFFGCPGEEGGAAKAFMARERLWEKLDAAVTWHPGRTYEVTTGTNNSCVQVLYKFQGVAAHAAGNPEEGRSALDAVELMNTGVNYLREHMKPTCRIHYAMVDGGGLSPNVVQPHASVLYMIRGTKVRDTLDLEKRVDKCASGAAEMTETTFEKVFIDGTAETVPNTVLEKLVHVSMEEIALPQYTAEELSFLQALDATCPKGDGLPGHGAKYDPEIAEEVKRLSGNGTAFVNAFLMPFYSGNEFTPGSTDVGDVSFQTPTVEFRAVTFPAHAPGHSWQNVSSGGSSVGDKGTLYAAKVLALSGLKLLEQPGILREAKAELAARLQDGGYVCPIPEKVLPTAIEET